MSEAEKILFQSQADELRREIDPAIRCLPLIAEVNYSYFQSLMKQGFSEEQSLELVKSQGMSLIQKPDA
ncbi:hypothetical protein FQ087_18825 [Sporosarcina sp. ANT_H38]|uniref:hypothetical protein n=1 Tax=Sporosarcina sp. ANT_H38 TaxID=2597358 RepID=UPI0011F3C93C|nr:hypothetical protein [Sporosarcina sp. ANT_H38]KAA0944179.1 hypothetical protein FQ087_18825 [Sporosarcina sp. ANT_H38]